MYLTFTRGVICLDQIMGLVKDEKFVPFGKRSEIKLETIAMQEARSPNPLDLTRYKGKVIMVSGDLHGNTMYSAKVIDEAGPILTAVAVKLFRKRSKR
jgi:hypothetical protein